VTGANGGLGRALVTEFAFAGAEVFAGVRDGALLEHDFGSSRIQLLELDVTKPSGWRLPDMDVVINNAGINRNTSFTDKKAEEALTAELEVNVLGTLRVVNHFLPGMIERREGVFINVISDLAFSPNFFCSTYSASKAALHSLGLSLRDYASDKGVHVMNVYPKAIDTRLTAGIDIPKDSPDYVARRILDALSRGEAEIAF
jgi:short-subunit dehydrogenase